MESHAVKLERKKEKHHKILWLYIIIIPIYTVPKMRIFYYIVKLIAWKEALYG